MLTSRVDGDGGRDGGSGEGMPIKYASENWIWNSYFSTARFHHPHLPLPAHPFAFFSLLYGSLAQPSFPEWFRSREKNIHSIPRLNTDVAIVRGTARASLIVLNFYVMYLLLLSLLGELLSFLLVALFLSFSLRFARFFLRGRTVPGTFSTCNGIPSGYTAMRCITFCKAQ